MIYWKGWQVLAHFHYLASIVLHAAALSMNAFAVGNLLLLVIKWVNSVYSTIVITTRIYLKFLEKINF